MVLDAVGNPQTILLLGGVAFATEVLSSFRMEAADILRQLEAANRSGNAEEFRDGAHALRSSAANVGAQGLFGLCLAVRQISESELAQDGSRHVRAFAGEFARVEAELSRLDGPPVAIRDYAA